MQLGNFSVSLAVKDIAASRAFYEKLGFAQIAGAVAVMPGLVDRCTVDGETVLPQPGAFYGGWVTSRVVGPFKGDVGTSGW